MCVLCFICTVVYRALLDPLGQLAMLDLVAKVETLAPLDPTGERDLM